MTLGKVICTGGSFTRNPVINFSADVAIDRLLEALTYR